MDDTLYEDPETGELLREDQVDWSRFAVGEDASPPEPRPEASWRDVIASGFANIPGAIAQAPINTFQMIAENAPKLRETNYFSPIADLVDAAGITPEKARWWQQTAERARENLAPQGEVPRGSMKDFVGSGITMAGSMMPAIITGNPGALLPDIAIDTIPNRYKEYRDLGLSPDEAIPAAIPPAAADTAGMAITFGALNNPASSMLKRGAGTILGMEAGGALSGATELVTDKFALGEPRIPRDELGRTMREAALRNAVHGAMLFGATGATERALGSRQVKTREQRMAEQESELSSFLKVPEAEPDVGPPTELNLDLPIEKTSLSEGLVLDLPQQKKQPLSVDQRLERAASKVERPLIEQGLGYNGRSADEVEAARKTLWEIENNVKAQGPEIIPGSAYRPRQEFTPLENTPSEFATKSGLSEGVPLELPAPKQQPLSVDERLLRASQKVRPQQGLYVDGTSTRTPESDAQIRKLLWEVQNGVKETGPRIIPGEAYRARQSSEVNPTDIMTSEGISREMSSPSERNALGDTGSNVLASKATTLPVVGDTPTNALEPSGSSYKPSNSLLENLTMRDSLPETEISLNDASRAVDFNNLRNKLPKHAQSVAVRTSEIGIRPDLFQYKSGGDIKGVNAKDRIPDKYDPVMADDLFLFEPKDPKAYGLPPGQKYLVADGHHRNAKAVEDGVEVQQSRIFKEADGWDADSVKIEAALKNIKTGKGSPEDAVNFFSSLVKRDGLATTEEKLNTIAPKYKDGASIGTYGSTELRDAFFKGKVTTAQAAAITRGAPTNNEVQRIALASAIKNPKRTALELELIGSDEGIRQALKDQEAAEKQSGGMGELFKNDLAFQRAVDNANLRAAARAQLIKEASEKRRFAKTITGKKTKNLVNEFDVTAGKEDALKQLEKDLEHINYKYKHSEKFPETEAEVTRRMREIEKKGLLEDESGSVMIPFADAAVKMGEKFKAFRARFQTDEQMIADIAKAAGVDSGGTISHRNRTESQRWFEGETFGRSIPGASRLRASVSKAIVRPMEVARKFPQAKEVMDEKWAQWRTRESTMNDSFDIGKRYWDLKDKTKVNKALAAARIAARKYSEQGKKLVITDKDLLNSGLSQAEVDAYTDVRKMLDFAWDRTHSAAKEHARQVAPEDFNWQKEIDDYFESNRNEHYAPMHRFGEYSVYAESPVEGGKDWYSLHDSPLERNKVAANLKKQGYKNIDPNKLLPESEEALANLPRNLQVDLKNLMRVGERDPALPKPKGMRAHMLHAELMDGYETNTHRSIAEYLLGMSSFTAKLEHGHKVSNALKKIDSKINPSLYDYMSRWSKYTDSNTEEMQTLKGFLAHYYLGVLNPKSALVNLTQNVTSTYPELGKYTKNPMRVLRESMVLARKAERNPEQLRKSDPDLYEAINIARREGVLDSVSFSQLVDSKNGTVPGDKTWSDFSMKFFSSAEKFNRETAFISGFRVGKGTIAERVRFAEDFVNQTQYVYSKMNRPELFRGKKGALFTFRGFGWNYLGNLKNNIADKEWAATVRSLGTMAALGGASALPLVGKDLFAALELAGFDPKKKLREASPSQALVDLYLYGIPFTFGLNLSNSVSPGEIVPDLEEGPLAATVRYVGGAPLAFAQRFARGANNYKESGEAWRAVEPILPESLRNLSVAGRWALTGENRDAKGNVTLKNPSPGQIATKAIGGTPSELTLNQEKLSSIYAMQKRFDEESAGLNRQIANALETGNTSRLEALLLYAKSKGIVPNMQAITRRRKEMNNPDVAAVLNAPKREGNAARKEVLDTIKTYRR